jgi:hypothetical protein
MIKDAKRYVLYNMATIEKAPLQVYVTALMFSTMKSIIRTLFRGKELPWITTSPRLQGDLESIFTDARRPHGLGRISHVLL